MARGLNGAVMSGLGRVGLGRAGGDGPDEVELAKGDVVGGWADVDHDPRYFAKAAEPVAAVLGHVDAAKVYSPTVKGDADDVSLIIADHRQTQTLDRGTELDREVIVARETVRIKTADRASGIREMGGGQVVKIACATPPLDWKYWAAELTVELPVTSKLMFATRAPRSAAQLSALARVE